MMASIRSIALIGFLMLLVLNPAAAMGQSDVAAFARLPATAHPALSPDGRWLSYIREFEDRRIQVVTDLAGEVPTRSVDVTGRKVHGVFWADDRYVITRFSSHASEVQGAGWLIYPIKDPHDWTDVDERTLIDALTSLQERDYRGEVDLGRFRPGDDPYRVR